MATVALSGIITPTNVVTATSTTTLSNKTLVAPALGTPASGVVTNLTGTASININGTVGATTPSTVVATTVQASTTMGVGGATPSTSGSGISFPATQSASSDANTLDDYEEGNWTPTLTAGTAPSSVSYNGRLGRYTKIGRQVTVSCSIQVNSVTGGSGDFYISGLPFTVFSSDVHFNGGLFLGQINWGSSRTSVIVDTGQNETNIYVYALGSGLSPTGIPLSEVADTNDYMNFNLTYFAA